MIQILSIFASRGNLQHFDQFTQIYFLGKDGSFHCLYFKCRLKYCKTPASQWCLLLFLQETKRALLHVVYSYLPKSNDNKFVHLHHNYPYLQGEQIHWTAKHLLTVRGDVHVTLPIYLTRFVTKVNLQSQL